ncbi:hypothetical protein PR048_030402 [Dryococelus australis]|uniref:Uncharacterized protein n=1 Tax=Dryococelus australis TaxID=614101 RepID=A0ABQ9GCR7_9NEOP|nr:hypothetical protein PR048_030402 [Dryococelus australis]
MSDSRIYSNVMGLSLILSRGNASVESGFSVNKSLIVDNVLEVSLVALRFISDSLKSMGGIEEAYLEKKNVFNAEEKQRRKKRNIEQLLWELEEKRKIMKLEQEKEEFISDARKYFFRI